MCAFTRRLLGWSPVAAESQRHVSFGAMRWVRLSASRAASASRRASSCSPVDRMCSLSESGPSMRGACIELKWVGTLRFSVRGGGFVRGA